MLQLCPFPYALFLISLSFPALCFAADIWFSIVHFFVESSSLHVLQNILPAETLSSSFGNSFTLCAGVTAPGVIVLRGRLCTPVACWDCCHFPDLVYKSTLESWTKFYAQKFDLYSGKYGKYHS